MMLRFFHGFTHFGAIFVLARVLILPHWGFPLPIGHRSKRQTYGGSDWMGQLPPSVSDNVPINGLAIPGTHNSFSNSLTQVPGPDLPPSIKDLLNFYVAFFPGALNEALGWSKCQNMGPWEQLELGIRYFDVRVAGFPDSDQTFITHGFLGEEVTKVLDEVNDFLLLHPKEVVLIDLQHFYNVSRIAHSHLLNFLEHKFGRKLTPRNGSFGTLKSLWDQGRQVVLIYQSEVAAEKNHVWDSNSIEQPFPDTDNATVLSTFLEETYGERSLDKLHVTQGILTPSQTTITAKFGDSIEGALAPLANHAVTEWLLEKQAGINGVNVVLVDYAEIGSMVPAILELNTAP